MREHGLDPDFSPAALTEIKRVEKIVPKEQAVLHLAYPTVPVSHPDQIALSILDEKSPHLLPFLKNLSTPRAIPVIFVTHDTTCSKQS